MNFGPERGAHKREYFPGNLVDRARNEKLGQLVRTESAEKLKERYNGKLEVSELVEVAEDLFGELEETYGIAVPARFFVGSDNSANSVVDRIEGKNLVQADVSPELVSQVQILYASIAKYFLDKYVHGGFYLPDLNTPNQYVYGKRPGENEDKIYLVDTDIYVHNSRAGLFIAVEWLTRNLTGVESKFGRMDDARGYIERFVSQQLPENMTDLDKNKVEHNIQEIKKFLKGEKLGPSPESAIPEFS